MKLLLNKNQFVYNVALYQVGYEKCGPHHSFGPILRDFYVLHFIVSGEGYIEQDNKVTKLKKGDLFLVPVNELVRYYSNPDDPYEYYWVGFFGVSVAEILKEVGFLVNRNLVIQSEDKFEELLLLFKKLSSYSDERSLKENLYMLGLFYQIVGALVPTGIEFDLDVGQQSALNLAVSYIEFNYSIDITMETLENVCHMHRSNLYRLFKKYYGISPSEYINEYRMDRSLYLLKNSDYSIKKIASMVGYPNTSFFCKIFKKKYHKTPSEARKLL
ncbi:MAG: helix-turn-helix domain-containing protein [Bacilli bacterium]|nr:helix-turn-helix domain-containing protein [Bacilli bacterium]